MCRGFKEIVGRREGGVENGKRGETNQIGKINQEKIYYAICHKNGYVFLERQRVRRVGCPTVRELNSSVHSRTTQE